MKRVSAVSGFNWRKFSDIQLLTAERERLHWLYIFHSDVLSSLRQHQCLTSKFNYGLIWHDEVEFGQPVSAVDHDSINVKSF